MKCKIYSVVIKLFTNASWFVVRKSVYGLNILYSLLFDIIISFKPISKGGVCCLYVVCICNSVKNSNVH